MKPRTDFAYQSGNVFFALFGAVGLVGILGASMMGVMRGPVTSMQQVTKRTIAENAMIAAGKLTIMAASQPGGDCDDDHVVEPPGYVPGGTAPHPQGGGLLPPSVGAAKQDPWGNEFGYCVWDHGKAIKAGACPDDATRLSGREDGAGMVVAVISSGPDRTFQTSCNDEGSGDHVDKPSGSDDIVMSYTYDEAVATAGGSGLWTPIGDDAAEIQRSLEVKADDGSGPVFAVDNTASGPSIKVDFIQQMSAGVVEFLSGIKGTDVDISGDLDVTGAATLGSTDVAGDLSATGAADLGSAEIAGGLSVIGPSTLSGLTAGTTSLGATQVSELDLASAGSTITKQGKRVLRVGVDPANNSNFLNLGYQAGSATNYQVALGYNAGQGNTENYQTAVGVDAGYLNTGTMQTAIGMWSGSRNTGAVQTALGYYAGQGNIASHQTALGVYAGNDNTGVNQVAVGTGVTPNRSHAAGAGNSGDYQTAIGSGAGYLNTGSYQTAVGMRAGQENTGLGQTALGYRAGANNIGERQLALGYDAGKDNTGHDVVVIGRAAGASNSLDNQFIVQQATVNTTPLIQGDFATGNLGIGTTSPSARLDVAGSAEINGQLDMTGFNIVNLAAPTGANDAVNKGYVDAQVAAGTGFEEQDPTITDIEIGKWCLGTADGITCTAEPPIGDGDTLAGLECDEEEIPKQVDGIWTCSPDTGSDNLGDHIATHDLDMAGFAVKDSSVIKLRGVSAVAPAAPAVSGGDSGGGFDLSCAEGEIAVSDGSDWTCASEGLGDHQSHRNIILGGFWISRDGEDGGLRIAPGGNLVASGKVRFTPITGLEAPASP